MCENKFEGLGSKCQNCGRILCKIQHEFYWTICCQCLNIAFECAMITVNQLID